MTRRSIAIKDLLAVARKHLLKFLVAVCVLIIAALSCNSYEAYTCLNAASFVVSNTELYAEGKVPVEIEAHHSRYLSECLTQRGREHYRIAE